MDRGAELFDFITQPGVSPIGLFIGALISLYLLMLLIIYLGIRFGDQPHDKFIDADGPRVNPLISLVDIDLSEQIFRSRSSHPHDMYSNHAAAVQWYEYLQSSVAAGLSLGTARNPITESRELHWFEYI